MWQRIILQPGEKYNRLTVLGPSDKKNKQGLRYYDCVCECGTHIAVATSNLMRGRVKSCGCAKREAAQKMIADRSKHCDTYSRLYGIWRSAKQRCYYTKHISFSAYGGRGITMCPEWRDSFEAFKEWAYSAGYNPNAPRGKCTLDRIDVDGPYSPENCRWVDMTTQARNRRTNRVIKYNGDAHTITEWAEITGIKKSTIIERLRKGWSEEDAITIPVRRSVDGHYLT